ncbi:hypothetical protein BV22DRAFT_491586 [Leucogyrophana mollusca]|uniref:Uncharacterized protein n=1 Tax=Leucogyrophana mollusca TaxID=85980 RepID=A0ACB8BFZ0_9AGAM|nr:hypothetical protein BV22DRAFT_491586 [Leucogyrophana mollusca]
MFCNKTSSFACSETLLLKLTSHAMSDRIFWNLSSSDYIFPFHLQARKLNIWTAGFVISPFLSPFALGFLVARTSWRWAYETMYDRTVKPIPPRPSTGLRYRVETLIGITGYRMAKFRPSWSEVVLACLNVLWRPQFFFVVFFEAFVFGFSIGINATNAVFMGSPPPVGFGFSQFAIAGAYGTPIMAVIIAELIGRFANDWIMNTSIRRNKGVFEAESRLWACYIAIPLFGWGIALVSVTVNTVAIYAYCNDCFPKRQGEVSALLNLARTLGGFAVPYFQVPWASKSGALQTFGVEAAIVAGLFLLAVPVTQWKGRRFRELYSL